jgi:superfamily II DNA/RNA helicase
VKGQSFVEIFEREAIRSFLREKAFERPTPVQTQVPGPFREVDLCVLAPTGSGKTLSYLLPMMDWVKTLEERDGLSQEKAKPRAIIFAPTRELTTQITQVAKELAHHTKLRVRQVEGHTATKSAREAYVRPIDILITAPGRALKDIRSGKLSLEALEVIVFDEADQMLDTSFMSDLKPLMELVEKTRPESRVHLFSATMGPSFDKLREQVFSRKFRELRVESAHHLSVKLETFNIYVTAKEKRPMLETFLKREAKGPGVIFVNTKKNVQEIETFLKESSLNLQLVVLHGEMDPKERREAHRSFKEGGSLLLATDIAARGLDQAELQWVLNYDLPFDPVYYVHRCGRVGRQGRTGLVYNFVSVQDLELIEKINEAIERQTALDLRPLKAGPLKRRPASSKKVVPESTRTSKYSKKKKHGPKVVSSPEKRKMVKKKGTPRYKKKK